MNDLSFEQNALTQNRRGTSKVWFCPFIDGSFVLDAKR